MTIETSYIGWIPCLNGNIDFGHMDVGLNGHMIKKNNQQSTSNTISYNSSANDEKLSHNREVVLQSEVNWMDQEWIGDFPTDSGFFRVTVVGKASYSDSMKERSMDGHILISLIKNEENYSASRLEKLTTAFKSNNKIEDSTEKFKELEGLIAEKNVTGLTNTSFLYAAKFHITSSGLIYIQDVDNSSSKKSYLFTRQAFYYLKYSLHKHQHHVDEQDSLTQIVPYKKNGNSHKEHVAEKLICQLKREITSIKRRQKILGKTHPTNNPLGIIAYTKSLVLALQSEELLSKCSSDHEIKLLNNSKEAFLAHNGKINEIDTEEKNQKSSAKIIVSYIVISYWAVANSFRPITDYTQHKANPLINFGDELWAWVPISLVVCFILSFVAYSAILYWYRSRYSLDFIEKLYGYNDYIIWLTTGLIALSAVALSLF